MRFLRDHPLNPAEHLGDVAAPGYGGTALFVGTVRDHHEGRAVLGLEYTAYGAMAEREAAAVLAEAAARWRVGVSAAHRLGALAVGEAAIVVAVGGAHRAEAFEACRWIVDAIKARVPIWKRERYADGSEAWVDPTAGEGA